MTRIAVPQPQGYVCPRTVVTPRLDGSLDEAAWGHAPWTADFVDIEGDRKPRPRFRTRARMLWDDDCLYIGAEMEEPHVWGSLTVHDSIIYHDNDFEVFIDPSGHGHHYVELEVNALNTTWDLLLPRPYRAGGFAVSGWEFHGVRTSVHIDGTLNDPSDSDRAWKVEIAIPWTSMQEVAFRDCPPRDGHQWRINFSRVEWQIEIVDGAYRIVPGTPEDNWVWSPQGAIEMHKPERWGVIQFSNESTNLPPLRPLVGWDDKLALVEVWEAQEAHRERAGSYTSSTGELGLDMPGLRLEATTGQFTATLGTTVVDHQLHFARA